MDFLNQTIGKYKLIRLIGEGSKATVYEGVHKELETPVAVKILHPVLSVNEQIRNRLENEIKLHASLHHPNIIRVIDYGYLTGRYAIIIEYLNGSCLYNTLQKCGSLSTEIVVFIFRQILSAFKYAHEHEIFHYDICPSNIFITDDAQVKILDFYFAKLLGTYTDRITAGILYSGANFYISPEQLTQDQMIDQRSDLYSLGLILYMILTGEHPYFPPSTTSVWESILFGPSPSLPEGDQFAEFIKKAVEKDRNRRYQTINEMIKDFDLISSMY